MKNHLNPQFGDLMLREITLEGLQNYLGRLPGAAESVDKVRDVLSAVLRTAVDYGRLNTNPVEKIRLKKRKLNKPKPFIRVDQFHALLGADRGTLRHDGFRRGTHGFACQRTGRLTLAQSRC